MDRDIMFEYETTLQSLGRNGFLRTCGISMFVSDDPNGRDCIVMTPITSRGHSESAKIVIESASAGDIGVTLIEEFCRKATSNVRQALLDRLAIVCSGEPDPVRMTEQENDNDHWIPLR